MYKKNIKEKKMTEYLVKVRNLQRELKKCHDVIENNITREKIQLLLLQLRQMEQDLLFKNVLTQKLTTKPVRHHLLADETLFRVSAEQSKYSIATQTSAQEKILKDLQDERNKTLVSIFTNRLAPVLIDNPNIDANLLVNQQSNIPDYLKPIVVQELQNAS